MRSTRSGGAAAGRLYFAAQAAAGAAWWVAVFTSSAVREATLGALDPVLVAALDLPLFVVGSAVAAAGVRWAATVTAAWAVLVAGLMALYATVSGLAGWGALLMIAAAACSCAAALLVLLGRLPTELLLIGPFAPREARRGSAASHVARTATQLALFWGLFLVAIPFALSWLEARWGFATEFPVWLRIAGWALLAAASALGLWSAHAMSTRGEGTPLPSATARRLVVSGPYAIIRNPMAVAGIAQGAAVGLLLGSWLVIAYALCGSLFWNWGIRPHEESELEARFGEEYAGYRRRVSCWFPRSRR